MNQLRINRLKMATEYKLLELRFTNVRCFREGNQKMATLPLWIGLRILD